MNYRIAFYGRRCGALGLSGFQVLDVVADSVDEAKLRAYDTHEHISGGLDGIRVVPRPSALGRSNGGNPAVTHTHKGSKTMTSVTPEVPLTMNRRDAVRIINAAYVDLNRMCESSSVLYDLLTAATRAALDGERRHRRGRFERMPTSHALRARYFVVKWVAEPSVLPRSWAEVCSLRDDVRLAYGLASAASQDSVKRLALQRWVTRYGAALRAIDYATHLVGWAP